MDNSNNNKPNTACLPIPAGLQQPQAQQPTTTTIPTTTSHGNLYQMPMQKKMKEVVLCGESSAE